MCDNYEFDFGDECDRRYGVQGIPDFICCAEGVFIAIKTKYGRGKPTKWQEIRLDEIDNAGGFAWVIDETNVGGLEKRLREVL